MGLLDKIMSGDVDGMNRELEERQFKRQAQFSGMVRDKICKQMRPMIAWWINKTGNHSPECPLSEKGDLLRWTLVEKDGNKYRMPTIRTDYAKDAIEGKIETKDGTELLMFIAQKLDEDTRNFFIAMKRSGEFDE